MIDYSFKSNKADYLLSVTAMLQPVLILLQLLMQDALHFDPNTANHVRVLATAIPVLLSMVIVVKRNFSLMLITYAIVLLVVLYTTTVYVGRWPIMREDVLKFTLPVVIPIGLCIASIQSLPIMIRSMQFISVFAAFIGLLYALLYLSGSFIIEGYSIAFSYALLFPTFIMISRKKIIWKCVAIVLMIEMLAIGSRGALLISIAYWGFSVIWKNLSLSKTILYLIVLLIAYLLFFDMAINFIADFFDSIGIHSRTLRLLASDELIAHDSGRDYIAERAWEMINGNPLFGNGVWADRQYIGIYCHNIFLEVLLDFGFLGGGLLILVFAIMQLNIFRRLPKNHKTMYIMMVGVMLPLMVSSSYLISFNIGMFMGFSYLMSKLNRQGLYQDYVFE